MIGYARALRRGPALIAQRERLVAAGVREVHEDLRGGATVLRPALDRAIAALSPGGDGGSDDDQAPLLAASSGGGGGGNSGGGAGRRKGGRKRADRETAEDGDADATTAATEKEHQPAEKAE